MGGYYANSNIKRYDMNNYIDVYKLLAKNIKHYRRKKKVNQRELAILTGYSYEYIRRIESSKSKKHFSIQTIYIISKALEIPMYKLFIFDNKTTNESEENTE